VGGCPFRQDSAGFKIDFEIDFGLPDEIEGEGSGFDRPALRADFTGA